MFNPQMKTTLTWINFGLTNGGHNKALRDFRPQ